MKIKPFSYGDMEPEKRKSYKSTLFGLQNSEGIDESRAIIIRKIQDADDIQMKTANKVTNIIDIDTARKD